MEPCLLAETLSNSDYMKCQLVGKIFTCLLGMSLIVALYKKYGIRWLGHVNAKVIFFAHLLFSFLVAFNFCIVHTFDLIRLSMTYEDKCDYLVPVAFSFLLRGPCQIFIYVQVLSMFALAIERLLAVWCPKEYEKVTRPTFAVCAIVLTIAFSIFFVLGLFLPGVDFNGRYPGFVSKTKENAQRFYIVIVFQFVPEVLTLIIFHVVRGRSKSKIEQDLSTRYQMEENRRVCHHLLPVFYTHAVILMCTAGGISLIPLYQSFFGLDDVTFAKALETTGWALLYAALMPIIVHLRYRYRKKKQTRRANLGRQSYFIPIDDYPVVLKRRNSWCCEGSI